MVVLVVFNVRGKGGNLREFFFLWGGGGRDCAVYFPTNTTHEKPKVGPAHFFSRAFAFSYEVALSLPFDNAELWMGSFSPVSSFFSPSFFLPFHILLLFLSCGQVMMKESASISA